MHSVWLRHLHTRNIFHNKIKERAKEIAKWWASKILHKKTNKIDSHSIKINNIMDKWIYGIALIWPLLTIPQVWMIWGKQSADSISLFTWGAYVLSAILWLTYGIIHKEKAIIFANILWMIVNIAVFVWAIIYW